MGDQAKIRAAFENVKFHLDREAVRTHTECGTRQERFLCEVSSCIAGSLWNAVHNAYMAESLEHPVPLLDRINNAARNLSSWRYLKGVTVLHGSDHAIRLRQADQPAEFAGRSAPTWAAWVERVASEANGVLWQRPPGILTIGTELARLGDDLQEALRYALPFDLVGRQDAVCREWFFEIHELANKGQQTPLITAEELPEVLRNLEAIAWFDTSPVEVASERGGEIEACKTELEKLLFQGLQEHGPMTGEKLAGKVGEDYNGHLKGTLSRMVRMEIIGNRRGGGAKPGGYFIPGTHDLESESQD